MNNTLLLVKSEGLGSAPHELQTILAINFFRNLVIENQTPQIIFFYADGVKLNLKGSVIEESLVKLEKRGTKILTCTTCLNYYKVRDELAVGSVSGMPELIKSIGNSSKVVTI
jgi:sulfur relay (sulfurtransferase) complex TusBCD TusD component (DsrE family)